MSYCLGWFAVTELLRHRPDRTRFVAIHSRLPHERAQRLATLCGRTGVDLRRDDALVERFRHKGNAYALGVFETYACRLRDAADHVLMVAPSHHGNLGTTLRSMAAFGVRDVALVAPATSVLHPHVVRASVGAAFAVRFEIFPDLDAYRARHGRPLYVLTARADRDLPDVRFADPCTLAFGPEWPAIDAAYLAAGTAVRIPMTGDVESLNLATSAAVALYALHVERRSRGPA